MKPLHIALALATALLWGFGFVTSKYGADNMPPLFFLALRFILVVLVLIWFVRVPRGRMLSVMIFALTMGAGHFGLFYVGLSLGVEASTAAIIWLTQVPMTVLLAAIFLKDRPGWLAVLGIAIAFVGVIGLVGEPRHMGNIWAICLSVASSVAWAVANIHVKHLTDLEPLALNAWMSVFSAIFMVILSLALETGQFDALMVPDWRLHGSLIYQVVGSTLMAYWAWYYLLRRYAVSKISGYMLLVPFFGVIGGIATLGEPLTIQTAIGGAATLLGVALIVLPRRETEKT